MCHYIVESEEVVTRLLCFFILIENKKVCAVTIHIQVNNITHPEREYIV
jgi:hypothetical protein